MLRAPTLFTLLAATAPAFAQGPNTKDDPFDANVKVEVRVEAWVLNSDGIPTHATAEFPNATNPNRILKQDYHFTIPRQPQKAEKPTPTPFGPIGVALNGGI